MALQSGRVVGERRVHTDNAGSAVDTCFAVTCTNRTAVIGKQIVTCFTSTTLGCARTLPAVYIALDTVSRIVVQPIVTQA
jgi:hypothetical protein